MTSEINECESDPCNNGASCVDEINAFRCICTLGFDGSTCENGYCLIIIKELEYIISIINHAHVTKYVK